MRQSTVLIVSMLIVGFVGFALAAEKKKKPAGPGPEQWVGKTAPEVKLPLLQGGQFDLASLKGKVAVLDIWATWCPPCRKSLPHIQEMSKNKELAAKGLHVVAVNHGEKADDVTPFMEKNKYTFTVAMDTETKLMRTINGRGIPTTLVIGRDGKVKNVFVGFGEGSAEQLDQAVKTALEEDAPKEK
jgi:thiol-disulfide isomerase/thioredoxin